MKSPDNTIYTPEDLANYANILHNTNAMKHNHNPMSKKPKSSKGQKYKKIIRPIWNDLCSGNGVNTIVISSDLNALIERLNLLLASKQAEHTGVINEIVSICNELLRQNIIPKETYKKINACIKNLN